MDGADSLNAGSSSVITTCEPMVARCNKPWTDYRAVLCAFEEDGACAAQEISGSRVWEICDNFIRLRSRLCRRVASMDTLSVKHN